MIRDLVENFLRFRFHGLGLAHLFLPAGNFMSLHVGERTLEQIPADRSNLEMAARKISRSAPRRPHRTRDGERNRLSRRRDAPSNRP